MGYVNNGTERSLKVTVNKVVGGNQVQGYPKTYDGQLGDWSLDYAALTDEEFRQLTEGEFTARYNAFVAYVEGVEYGADFDTDVVGDGAIRDGATCLTTTSTTTIAAANSYSFAIKYGALPADACAGAVSLCYSNVPIPGVGSLLYKDAGLTQPWDSASAILFVSPELYGKEVAAVCIAPVPEYSIGEIMLLTGYICDVVTVTTTINPIVCYPFSTLISWSPTQQTACDASFTDRAQYYGNSEIFANSTTISASPTCSPTLGGYYSDGNMWKYTSDGRNFTSSGYCNGGGGGIIPLPSNAYEVQLSLIPSEICTSPFSIVYTVNPNDFRRGVVIYSDEECTTPVASNRFVVKTDDGIVYRLDPIYGIIGYATGSLCAPK